MHYLRFSQKVPINLEDCWDFFSSPSNLKRLTPAYLGFQITNQNELGRMYPGQIIAYIIKPLGFPIEWITEITHVERFNYFIDEQRSGPYKMWHHEHHFNKIHKGVEIVDTIYYKLPLGFLGKLLHHLKVKKDINAIFSFREAKLVELFGHYTEKNKSIN